MAEANKDQVGTTGHEWDGIQELENPMPRWWLWTYYATIVWAIGYVIAYPAIPMLTENTKGMLGYTSRGAVAQEIAAVEAGRAGITAKINATAPAQLAQDPQLMQAAIEGGRSAFKVYCVQCHGAGAAGGSGYPNLNDDDWLWGGDMESIHTTLVHGIRSTDDDQTRTSMMPAFGRDGILQPRQIDDVAEYVLKISGAKHSAGAAARGAVVFAEQCVACHGEDGKGNRMVGAPNLADPIWLYGGDKASIVATVTNSRSGVMPSWGKRLPSVTVKQLAAYVHSLGGGE